MSRCFILFRRTCVMMLLLALLFPSAGLCAGHWTTLTDHALPENQVLSDEEFTGSVTITFLGDCTLGGEEKNRGSALSFARRVEDNGYEFPLGGMSRLTRTDDLTVANLECVLTDRKLRKTDKKFNFSGPTAYTEILTSAGADCVTIANNHSHDYGEEGYADTKAALEAAGVCWFGTDAPAIWQSEDGLLLGFVGVNYSLNGNRYKQYARQMNLLKEMGCAAIITVMHAGTEYSYTPPDNYQRQIVSRAVECGSSLIIGHHPHVVQGYDIIQGVPVVYSLGNCSFGGTTHAKDSDALVVQAVLSFREGVLTETELHFYPISITSDGHYNNYSPCFLTGRDAQRVLDKMRKSTGKDPGEFDEATGAVVTLTPAP